MSTFQSICLCMIVKNEAAVIRRCIDSVRPLITHWLIVDTGSTDGTPAIIKDCLRDVPGELHERPWKDFAHNRTEALALARPLADYSFIIDADDVLELPEDFASTSLTADGYTVDIRDGSLVYPRVQLVSNRFTWCYRGTLHEFIISEDANATSHLPWGIRRNHDGARRKDPNCFTRDAEILEKELLTETDPMLVKRYMFYLAQSYRDGGQVEKALNTYLRRAALGGWQEEVYVSLYQAARLMERLEYSDLQIIDAYEAATSYLPLRGEAAYWASRYCRTRGLNRQGYDIAQRCLGRPVPAGSLFAEPWIYETGLLDEYAVNAYWVGRYEDCLEACLKILSTGRLGGPDLQRVISNALLAWEKLKKPDFAARVATPAAQMVCSQTCRSTDIRPQSLPGGGVDGDKEWQMTSTGTIDPSGKAPGPDELLSLFATAIGLARDALKSTDAIREARRTLSLLSVREREIVDAIVNGHSSKQIAKALSVNPRSVEVHRASFMDKLGAPDHATLVRLAVLAGMGSPQNRSPSHEFR